MNQSKSPPTPTKGIQTVIVSLLQDPTSRTPPSFQEPTHYSSNMVQRKPSKKLGPQIESPERRSSSNPQQDTRIKEGGGGDQKRKMKKSSPPIKSSDGSPNYMKPTSSSGARKERLQVPVNSPITTDKNRSPSNNSKPSSSSVIDSVIKLARSLTRSSSLRPVRSSMKKSSGVKNVSRATCSSTLKDSKIPKDSELNPQGIESEETSILKVCPYTYCSMSGHKHESLPPVKSFMSARRRLIKTQTSMKLKRLSSLMAISSTPSGLQINPLFEEVGNDFFVEIHAKPREEIIQFANCDDSSIRKKHDMENSEAWTVNPIHESSSDINSNKEMDVLINSREYVECDRRAKAKKEVFGNDSEANLAASFEAIDMHFKEEAESYSDSKTDYSEYLDDEFNRSWSFEQDSNSFTSDADEEEKIISSPRLSSSEPLPDSGEKPKSRHNRMRRKTTEEMEAMREFNPRAPRFLPLEPDPEAEKVDLRRSLIDGKKSAEEWMIDYALRQAVKKLAPARKKKVELLVEAFETVMPLDLCETPLRPVSGFARPSPIQACN